MKFLSLLFTLWWSSGLMAGWQEPGQESLKFSKKIRIEINENGSYVENQIISITPKNLESLEESKIILLSFDEEAEKIELKWVKLCLQNKDKCEDISLDNIVYEIGEKEASGFSSQKRLKFVVRNFKLNQKIVYKFTKTVSIPDLNNNFMGKYYFGHHLMEEDSEIEIKSKIPLFYSMNNLNNFKILKKTLKHLHLKQNKEIYQEYINFSDENVFERDDQYAYLSISSFKDWDSLIEEEVKNYKISSFPEKLNEISNKIKSFQGIESKLEFLSIWIIENFTYFGDWKRVNGGFRPRKLDAIIDSKYGDCKDLSQITTEILKESGVDASIAFVNRDEDPQTTKFDLPSSYYFNHAIVQVYHDGKRYWLDPTNKFYGFNVIPEDIVSKLSLVIEGKGKGLTLINERDSLPSYTFKNAHILNNQSYFSIKMTQKIFGLENAGLAPVMKVKSKDEIKDLIKNVLSESKNEEVTHLELQLNRPYVLDEKVFIIRSKKENVFDYKTQKGYVYSLGDGYSKIFKLLHEDSKLIGKLGTYSNDDSQWEFEGYQLIGMKKFNCEVSSKWFSRALNVNNTNKSVVVTDSTEIKSSLIKLDTQDDLNAFSKFYKEYKNCYKKAGLLIEKI